MRRGIAEIELAITQIRHARQALAERIEADHVGVHLPDAHCQGIDLFLQHAPYVLNLRLFAQQPGGQAAQLVDRVRAAVRPQAHANGKCAAYDDEHHRDGSSEHQRVAQVQLFDTAGLAANKYDIHREIGSETVIGCTAPGWLVDEGVRLCRIR